MAYTNYIYVRYHNMLLIEDCLSIIASFIYFIAFKIIQKKINIYYTYFSISLPLLIRKMFSFFSLENDILLLFFKIQLLSLFEKEK